MSEMFDKPILIVVEGIDDKAIFRYFTRDRNDVGVYAHDGGGDLAGQFRALADVPGFADVRRVVVVHDADKAHRASLQKVWTHLTNAWNTDAEQEGHPVTWSWKSILRRLPEDEWIVGPEGREWKIWIMPGNGPGDLEELLWQAAIRPSDQACIDTLLACLEPDPPYRVRTKARLKAYLAIQRDPVPTIGRVTVLSTRRSGIDLAHPALESLRQRIAAL